MSATATGISRRERILHEAARLFSANGYHATSMRHIGERSGLQAGSLYAHISGKEELLHAVVQRAAERFHEALRPYVAGEHRDPEERFRLAMRAHVGVIAENLEAARVFHHEWRALTGPRLEEARRLRDEYERSWDGIIEGLGPADAKFARLLVMSAANWIYTWYDPRGSLSPDQIADRMADLVLEGIRGHIKEVAS